MSKDKKEIKKEAVKKNLNKVQALDTDQSNKDKATATKKSPVRKTQTSPVTKKSTSKKDYSEIYDKLKAYTPNEALSIIRKLNKAKFDASLEVHFRLGIDTKKGDQQVRGAASLPHGTGKTLKVAAFVLPENEQAAKEAGADLVGGEDLIKEIKKSEKTDFQVAVAEPGIMKSLSMIAKILGTRGLMPSPKNETVTQNPAKAVAELKKGKISFKNDDTANVHALIGKMSFSDEQLLANYESLLETLKKSRPSAAKGTFIRNISLSASMSPGVKVIVS